MDDEQNAARDADAVARDASPSPIRAPDEVAAHLDSNAGLALELTGGLPCIRCTYDLRGLSVRGLCPECGTPIRATILARVDPLAKELQPIYTPRLTAGCMVLWALAALGAAIAAWVPRAIEAINRLGGSIQTPDWPGVAVVVCVAASGLAAVALIRPHAHIPVHHRLTALSACVLYVPLAMVLAHIYSQFDARNPRPYLAPGSPSPARAAWRLSADCLIVGIVIGLRPSARILAARSFVLRTGRVDRQTMYALAAAVGVCALGDVLALVVGYSTGPAQGPDAALVDLLRMAATLCVGVGSLLVTLGLGSVVVDVVRLVPVVASPPLALTDITAQAVPAPPAATPASGDAPRP